MNNRSLLGTGWAFPVTTDPRGAIKTSREEKNIEESIRLILGTTPGERLMHPDFGCAINNMVFSPNSSRSIALAVEQVKEALVKWEPRIIVKDVSGKRAGDDETIIQIHIAYELRSVNTFFNLVYPFYLERGEYDSRQQLG
jgi:phage baseplate assembly protein W